MTDSANPIEPRNRAVVAEWQAAVADYQKPHPWRATWQIVNSFGSYVLLWYLMYLSLGVSWWLTAPLAVLASGVLVRVFIIFHDCGHGSYFVSRRANRIVGFVAGLLTFTPYGHWRWQHAVHHATAGDLDRRGAGDVWTLTVQEYVQASRWRKFAYRLARNPFVLFVLAPIVMFLFVQRVPSPEATGKERHSVWWMNLAILGMVLALSSIYGFVPYLIIQLSITALSGAAGIWLFYVQHQFEDAYWQRAGEWDYTTAALRGSSFYKLPKVLQWFSGNIGFHHVHHLSPRIPNYNLERCHDSAPLFQGVAQVTVRKSLKSLTLHLWDESSQKLISFRALRRARKLREREDRAASRMSAHER